MEEQKITEQNVNLTEKEKTWVEKELNEVQTKTFDGEKLPTLKFEENKETIVKIDFSKEFNKYTSPSLNDPNKQVTKAIIPCEVKEEKYNWWLNIYNPIYKEILELGKTGCTTFKILRTGQMKNTKYILVK